ncbi:hypothetical protein [Sphaerisporangium aureirubrum]|uniref:Uncharacterized protein n=1 Tax=Sphaerisporangium aureirubrum TaxID=1544736 RepID=A0ABW1ND20_9ACTN
MPDQPPRFRLIPYLPNPDALTRADLESPDAVELGAFEDRTDLAHPDTPEYVTYYQDRPGLRVFDMLNEPMSMIIRCDIGPFVGTIQRVRDQVLRFTVSWEDTRERHREDYGDQYTRHRRRCYACNPAGNPLPLTIDGHEYARRRRARARRR